MLKSWLIQNFKPILDSGELRLAPVTVLAGRNSSGKSSLIQSILMIAQTLSSRVLDRPLLPHGPMVQLGTFEDILSDLNEHTGLRTLVVGFEIEMEKEELNVSTSSRTKSVKIRDFTGLSTDIKSVKVTAQFRSANSNGTSTSAIEASKVNIESVLLEIVADPRDKPRALFSEMEDEIAFQYDIDIRRLTPIELKEFLKDVASEYLGLVPYTINEANYLGISKLNEASSNRVPEPSLITFSHFLPTRLTTKYMIEERHKSNLIDSVTNILTFLGKNTFPQQLLDSLNINLTLPVSQSSKEAIFIICKDIDEEVFSGHSLLDLILWYRSLSTVTKHILKANNFILSIAHIIVEDASQGSVAEALEAINDNFYVKGLESGIEQITQFFTSKIRYLGPLRADPQAVQRFALSSEPDDVGSKGESAAVAYDANQNAPIQWYNPVHNEIERNTLEVALNTWVSYLGVANGVKTEMAGQSGVSWRIVHMEGRKALPLTAVGVGVSQILPILVMGLLAPVNTLLLIEQPELHLHPSVQARLGDFFMSLAKCGKQCLIETHSENLVSQLRYHIVQAGGQKNSDCLIYFVDQDQQGATRFNPIEISPKGNILNWPDGFFDETMLQEDRIVAAERKKRAQKADNG